MCVTLQLLTIGAGLSQPKELKDVLENLIVMIVRVLKDCRVQAAQLNDVFSALIEYVLGCIASCPCAWSHLTD